MQCTNLFYIFDLYSLFKLNAVDTTGPCSVRVKAKKILLFTFSFIIDVMN